MNKILVRTQNGRLINLDHIIVIHPDFNIITAVLNTSHSRYDDVEVFTGSPKEVKTWMKLYNREFECAGNLPTYIIDVNDEAKGAK